MNLYYNFDARHLCDALGDPVSDLPEIAFNEQPVWNITPLRADGQRMDLSAVVAWRAAIDSDFTSETDVMCRTLPEAISVSDGTVSVPLDSNTNRFLQVVDRFESRPAYFELCGLDAAGKRIFYLIFRITARMVLDPGSTDSLPDAADLFAAVGDVDAGVDSFGIGNAEWIADDVPDFTRFRVDEGVLVRAGFGSGRLPGDSEWRRNRLSQLLRGDGGCFEDREGSEQDRESDPPQLRQVFRNQVHGPKCFSWGMCTRNQSREMISPHTYYNLPFHGIQPHKTK